MNTNSPENVQSAAQDSAHPNPLLNPSTLPYELPPFELISVEHYAEAFDEAIARHQQEIAEIAENSAEPTWENTVEALERSGSDLDRVMSVFFNLQATDGTEEYSALAADFYPRLAAHHDGVYHNEKLFDRVKQATVPTDTPWAPEAARLKDHLIREFKRAGAELSAEDKATLSELNQKISSLSEQFSNNLRTDTQRRAVHFESEDSLAGLPAARIAAARELAQSEGKDGYLIPLESPSVQQEQARLSDPAAREELYSASLSRGSGVNEGIVVELATLRAQRAELLGYSSHAEFAIETQTAGSAQAVWDMLRELAPAASANAEGERKLLAEEAELSGQEFGAAHWAYWQSRVRQRDFNLDAEELRQYFPLDVVLTEGVFAAAQRLYGITVHPRPDLKGYAEGVKVWEVKEEDGTEIGLFITDYFARPTKRGGAWNSSFRSQSHLTGTKPVVVNVMNLTRPADGNPALLNLDELTTLYHEFGHALHALLSDVRYPTFSGTNVPRDWVEFPSQINENWALDPALVTEYARHVDTGEPIPQRLLDAIEAAGTFGQGFATTEYLAASVVDMAWHSVSASESASLPTNAEEIAEFEANALAAVGLTAADIAPRYRSNYFAHIFSGGYSAGYYSYLWAEALDADGFSWFREVGAASPENTVPGSTLSPEQAREAGQKFRDLVLSTGASRDFDETYRQLRGRDKDLRPLLERRGLAGATTN